MDNISPGNSTSPDTLGGMRAYLEDLVEFLPDLRPGYTFKLFTRGEVFSAHRALADNVQVVSCRGVPSHRVGRVIYEQTVLPCLMRREKVDVWLGTCNILPLACPCPSVVIVQSLQYFAFPRAYSLAQRLYLRAFGPASARRADKVIALSFAARDAMVKRLGIPAGKVVVAHNGLSRAVVSQLSSAGQGDADVVRRLTGKQPYALSVSSFYEYKNLARLIQAFAQIHSGVTQQLIIVGAETSRVCADSLKGLARRLDVQDRVVFAGHVSHEQIAAFYRHADALVMPSLEETFGLPILEAMALGCPVVTSNIGSMAEIAGDAAQLVDPWNVGSIAAGIKMVLNDAGYRDELRRRGHQQAARFVNSRSMDKIAAVLDEVSHADDCH